MEPLQTGLRLSEAIRKGALLAPQTRCGRYTNRETGATCAFGAAYEAVTGEKIYHGSPGVVPPHWDLANQSFFTHFGFGILYANDVRAWSREQIADALEALGH